MLYYEILWLFMKFYVILFHSIINLLIVLKKYYPEDLFVFFKINFTILDIAKFTLQYLQNNNIGELLYDFEQIAYSQYFSAVIYTYWNVILLK